MRKLLSRLCINIAYLFLRPLQFFTRLSNRLAEVPTRPTPAAPTVHEVALHLMDFTPKHERVMH